MQIKWDPSHIDIPYDQMPWSGWLVLSAHFAGSIIPSSQQPANSQSLRHAQTGLAPGWPWIMDLEAGFVTVEWILETRQTGQGPVPHSIGLIRIHTFRILTAGLRPDSHSSTSPLGSLRIPDLLRTPRQAMIRIPPGSPIFWNGRIRIRNERHGSGGVRRQWRYFSGKFTLLLGTEQLINYAYLITKMLFFFFQYPSFLPRSVRTILIILNTINKNEISFSVILGSHILKLFLYLSLCNGWSVGSCIWDRTVRKA